MRRLLNVVLGLSTVLLLSACGTPMTGLGDVCRNPSSMSVADRAAAQGRPMLSQGIALFDAKNLRQSERAFQSALFAGLSDRQERSLAHKYLAYIACSNSEWSRCEGEFDSAFSAYPSFVLEPHEIQNTPWADAYLKAQNRWLSSCARAGFTTSPQATPLPTEIKSEASGFPVNSAVVTGTTPMATAPTVSRSASDGSMAPERKVLPERKVPAGSNVKLRVSPWAVVRVDGKRVGVTPPITNLSLATGSRTIELSNPGFETLKRVVQVTKGTIVTITHDFDSR